MDVDEEDPVSGDELHQDSAQNYTCGEAQGCHVAEDAQGFVTAISFMEGGSGQGQGGGRGHGCAYSLHCSGDEDHDRRRG